MPRLPYAEIPYLNKGEIGTSGHRSIFYEIVFHAIGELAMNHFVGTLEFRKTLSIGRRHDHRHQDRGNYIPYFHFTLMGLVFFHAFSTFK